MEEEANGISAFIEHLTSAARGYNAGEIMVLSPRRLLGYRIRDCLLNRGIAVHSFYHEEMLEGTAVQRAFALLTLLVNREDRVALRFWLGYGSPSWRAGAYKRLFGYCIEKDQSPWSALEDLDRGEVTLSGTKQLVARFKDLKEELAALEPLMGQVLMDYLFPETEPENAAIREAAQLASVDTKGAKDILQALTSVITQPAMPEVGEFVRVMSLHKSKGLTSKAVIVAGCVQGLIPFLDRDHTPSEASASLKEQRRLLYVALTRATDTLVISSFATIERSIAYKIGARIKQSGGNQSHALTVSSQFLKELGPAAPTPLYGRAWLSSQFA
jgi:superfamily I DNA/RNA helicase